MDTASERLEKYITEAREIVRSTLSIDFDDDTWQLPYTRPSLKYIKNFNWKGLPPALANLAKAIVANETLPNNGSGRIGWNQFIRTIRWLAQIFGERRDVITLSRKDFDLLARALEEHEPRYTTSSLSAFGGDLKQLVNVCNLRGLTEFRINWANPFPSPDKDEHEHLIPPEAFKAFGEIRAAVMATDDNDPDRLLVHAITILVCTGMRIGELLTMPVDCWHEGIGEDDEGRILKGVWLGYAPEKRGLTEDTFPRWIPTVLVPVVKESVDEIHRITALARENARVLADGYVNLPIYTDKLYSLQETSAMLGYADTYPFSKNIKILGIATWKPKSSNICFTGAQIAQYVRQYSVLEPVMTVPFRLDLHESLFVIPDRFFQRRRYGEHFGHLTGTAKPMSRHQIAYALRSNRTTKSLFERFDKLDPKTGQVYGFATHDPRHTLTTWQIRHGLDAVEVAAYFGRSVEQPERANSFYDHMTQEQRIALVDRALETGRFHGGWADEIARIKNPIKRESMRHRVAGDVGYSQLGICSHPEGGVPPTTPEACSSCPGLLVIPGSHPHQERALEIQKEIEDRISVYETQVREGVFMAGKWLDVEYKRQANHRKVLETLFSRPPLKPGEEPVLVQMGSIHKGNTKATES